MRIVGARRIALKAIVSIDMIAFYLGETLVYLDHMLIDPNPGGAIPIVHGDQDGRHCND